MKDKTVLWAGVTGVSFNHAQLKRDGKGMNYWTWYWWRDLNGRVILEPWYWNNPDENGCVLD